MNTVQQKTGAECEEKKHALLDSRIKAKLLKPKRDSKDKLNNIFEIENYVLDSYKMLSKRVSII